jgi:5-methylcytosine-specific restriction endonuclease McrA
MPYKNKKIQLKYQRNWIQKRRKLYFKNKHCAKCGSTKRLEIDHIDSKTKISNHVWSWSLKRRIQELEKCQILCYICHKKKHATTHGNFRMYHYYKCRCKKCVTHESAARKQFPSRSTEARRLERIRSKGK